MPKPLADREPLDHNGECVYCDEPALTVADHAPDCIWRLAVEEAYPLPPDDPNRKTDCEVSPVSSRMCERGTKGCTVRHV